MQARRLRVAAGPEGDLDGVSTAIVANTPNAIMVCDRDLIIRFLNDASRRLLQVIAPHLPVAPEAVLGSSIDIFHRLPQRVRHLLATPENLPYEARIHLGPEVLELKLFALFDGAGAYTGPAVSWSVITARVALEERDQAMLEALGRAITRLGAASADLGGVSVGLNDGSVMLARRMASIQGATAEVRATFAAVASATDELSATLSCIERDAAESATSTSSARELAHSAGTALGALIATTRDIGRVTDVISHIAEQTRTLAFNAALEAARAGELGKGFGVVASEVKSLAVATTSSSRDIVTRIASMHRDAARSALALDSLLLAIDQVNERSASIASAVTEQGAAVRHIAESANRVAVSMNEVAAASVDADGAARQTAEQAGVTRAALASLNVLVGELEALAAGKAKPPA